MRRRDLALLIAVDRSVLGGLLGGLVNAALVLAALVLLCIAGWALILWWALPAVVHVLVALVLAVLLVAWVLRRHDVRLTWRRP